MSFDAVRHGPALVLMCAVAALLGLLSLEFGHWRSEAIAVDELHFAVCAARGNDVGDLPVAGCHDNKTPLIYALHQLVQGLHGLYALAAIKVWAILFVLLNLAAVAWLVARYSPASGISAAAVAVALAIQPLTADAPLLGLKTETLSMAFVLPALATTVAAVGAVGRVMVALALVAGLGFGMAIATKQTHLLVPLAVGAVLVLWLGAGVRTWRFLCQVGPLVALGCVAPIALLALAFASRGDWDEFVGNLLVYPGVYGGEPTHSWLQRQVWKAHAVAGDLARTPAPWLLALIGLALALRGGDGRPSPRVGAAEAACWAALLALVLAVVLSPIYFAYHLVPVWLLLAVLGGFGWARVVTKRAALPLAWLLLGLSVLHLAVSVHSEGGRRGDPIPAKATLDAQVHPVPGSRTGWVLGMWPEFYVHRGLVPASSVLYPWALPGAPANPLYRKPAPGTPAAIALRSVQDRNLHQLYTDFASTRPDVLAIVEPLARAPESSSLTDVPGLELWIAAHCRPLGRALDGNGRPAQLFDCTAKPGPPIPAPEATAPSSSGSTPSRRSSPGAPAGGS
jgi:hypothetical protein